MGFLGQKLILYHCEAAGLVHTKTQIHIARLQAIHFWPLDLKADQSAFFTKVLAWATGVVYVCDAEKTTMLAADAVSIKMLLQRQFSQGCRVFLHWKKSSEWHWRFFLMEKMFLLFSRLPSVRIWVTKWLHGSYNLLIWLVKDSPW